MEHYRRKNREMDEKVRSKTPEQIYASGGDPPNSDSVKPARPGQLPA